MKIVVDLQSCQSGSALGGIGRYSMNLLHAMLRNSKQHEFHIVLSALMLERVPHLIEALQQDIPKKQIHLFDVPGPVFEANSAYHFNCKAAEFIREYFIASLKPDVVHVTSLIEGFTENITTSIGQFTSGKNTA